MAIAHDAASRSHGTDAGGHTAATAFSWTHTPVGTPRVVVVTVTQPIGSGDEVSGVTYGGVTVPRAVSGVRTTTEAMRVYIYFLGSGIPTGAQTVQVTSTGTAAKQAHAFTATAAWTTVADSSTSSDLGIVANPSVTVTHSKTLAGWAGYAAHGYGANGVASTGLQTDETYRFGHDPGAAVGMVYTRHGGANAASSTYGYTTLSSDDQLIAAIVIAEAPAGASTCNGGGDAQTLGGLPVGSLARGGGDAVTVGAAVTVIGGPALSAGGGEASSTAARTSSGTSPSTGGGTSATSAQRRAVASSTIDGGGTATSTSAVAATSSAAGGGDGQTTGSRRISAASVVDGGGAPLSTGGAFVSAEAASVATGGGYATTGIELEGPPPEAVSAGTGGGDATTVGVRVAVAITYPADTGWPFPANDSPIGSFVYGGGDGTSIVGTLNTIFRIRHLGIFVNGEMLIRQGGVWVEKPITLM